MRNAISLFLCVFFMKNVINACLDVFMKNVFCGFLNMSEKCIHCLFMCAYENAFKIFLYMYMKNAFSLSDFLKEVCIAFESDCMKRWKFFVQIAFFTIFLFCPTFTEANSVTTKSVVICKHSFSTIRQPSCTVIHYM
jgi:hypothetical protein